MGRDNDKDDVDSLEASNEPCPDEARNREVSLAN